MEWFKTDLEFCLHLFKFDMFEILKFRKYLPGRVCMLTSKKLKSFTRHNYESNMIFVIIAHLF